ncbi:hypothetical protein ACTOVL_05950 [Arcanobacterium canis]
MAENVVYGPADVATGVLRFLRGHEVDAVAEVPLDMRPGTVHASRVAGEPISAVQESASVLIECWDSTQRASFALARRLWALFAAVSRKNQEAFPGLTVFEATPSMPVEYPQTPPLTLTWSTSTSTPPTPA